MTENANDTRRASFDPSFWISIYRGLSALVLGIVLLIAPDKSRAFLANTMGIFWLTTGLALLRRNRHTPFGKRTSQVIGLVVAATGILVVARSVIDQWIAESIIIQFLGIVIMLTGLLHVGGHVRATVESTPWRRILSILLGVAEIALGLALFLSPTTRSTATYWIATIWSFVFCALAIVEALTKRRHRLTEGENS
jgi:uncharacterized membrane protein HdeD (DUF308 family)